VCIGCIGEERANGIKTICCSGNAGVKYRHGVALVLFFPLDMWVAGVGSVLHVYGVVCIIASPIPRWFVSREVR
jgi:hypothetical protein